MGVLSTLQTVDASRRNAGLTCPDVKGVCMYLLSRGSGYPVLFIHGIPTSSRLWSGVVQKMRDSFTCLAVDLPGLGKTPKTSDGLRHLENLAEEIEQIRVENKIEKWHVVGHDAGSAIAVHYTHRFQDRVDRLALLSPAVFPELKPFHLFRIVRSPVIGELLAPAVNAIFWKVAMRQALEPRRSEFNDTVEDFHAPFSGPLGAWRMMSILRWGNPAEVLASLPAMLPQLKVPTLIFQGSRDKAVPEQFALRAGALIPQSKIIMVDSGHFIPLNNPEVVATELLSFFRETSIRDRQDCETESAVPCFSS
jgi:pimeloyl-ACP methyl ester carboxylesterase